MNYQAVWDSACQLMKAEMSDVTYSTWIAAALKPLGLSANRYYIEAATDFYHGFVVPRYSVMISNAIKQVAIQNATDAYLLADRSKLSKVGLFRIAGLDAFTTVYLDGPSPEEDFPSNVVFVEEET